MLRSPFQRLALLLPLLVSVIVALVFFPLYRQAESLIRDEVHAAIEQELQALDDHLHAQGMEGLIREINDSVASPVDPDAVYLLETASGQRLAGNLSAWPAGLSATDEMWFRVRDADGQRLEGKVFVLFGGEHLLVGRRSPLAHFRESMLMRLFGSAALIILVTAAGSVLFTRYLHRRLGRLAGDADAILRGHLSRRLHSRPDGDELDVLSARFNAAFDEIEQLVDATRHVSSALAHDMRRPLIALRQSLDEVLAAPEIDARVSERLLPVSAQVDQVLQTFAALLRLGRLEAGAWTPATGQCALDEIVADAVDLHRPLADAAGRLITLNMVSPAVVAGDRQLLSQLVCNLLENALSHGGGLIAVTIVRSDDGQLQLQVRDHGHGVPEPALTRLFDRFYQVDTARGESGHGGVGLTLVRAIARFHGGDVSARNCAPGLAVVVRLPAAAEGCGYD